jgi:hypothetical protein
MRENVEAECPEDYFRKSITVPFLYCTLNEMKTRFTDLHARPALGLLLVSSIIENIHSRSGKEIRYNFRWLHVGS